MHLCNNFEVEQFGVFYNDALILTDCVGDHCEDDWYRKEDFKKFFTAKTFMISREFDSA